MKSLRTIIIAVAAAVALTASADDGKKWLAKAKAGDAAAMHETADRYFYGYDGLPHDEEQARYWAEKGGDLGNVNCMLLAALTYYDDYASAKFSSKSLEWNAKAGETGNLKGTSNALKAMLAIKDAADNADDRLRALKGAIYWNDKRLANSALKYDYKAREEAQQLSKKLQQELEAAAPAPQPQEAEPQQQPSRPDSDEKIFFTPEKAPEFPGGNAALYGFLARTIRYPEAAVVNNIQGRVVVQCVIETDGSVSNVKVSRGVSPELDAEAVRVVKALPKFTPGMMSGRPVRVRYTLPITFKMH